DGKFVVPLAQAGYKVAAVEVNGSALYGTPARRNGQARETYDAGGLMGTLRQMQLESQVTVVSGDVCEVELPRSDAVWTSCSWHYSMNHDRPLAVFVDALTRCVGPSGIFGAEYFMPVAVTHVEREHYLEQGAIWSFLPGWRLVWEAYTPRSSKRPTLANPICTCTGCASCWLAADESVRLLG